MKKTKKLICLLLLVVIIATVCAVFVGCDENQSKRYTLSTSTLSFTYNLKANQHISIDIKTPDTYRAYRITVTGKDANGKDISIGNKKNYHFSIYRQSGSSQYRINEISETLICTTTKEKIMSYDFDTIKNENWTIMIDPLINGTYTVKIAPVPTSSKSFSPAKETKGYNKEDLVTSQLWVNHLPDSASEKLGNRAQIIAYINRNDISTFIEAIQDKNSSSPVANALVKSFGFAAGFIPYVGTGLSVVSYVKDIIDGFDKQLYSVKTQNKVIDAFEKAFKTKDYRKVDFKHGMKVVFINNGWGGYNITISKWTDNKQCTLTGASGCSGYFVTMREAWNYKK